MIKRFFALTIISAALIYGCSKEKSSSNVQPLPNTGSGHNTSYRGYGLRGTFNDDYSASIPVDSANRMIESYLTSINYPANDSGLRSLSFSADSLRAYLDNADIKTIKFMFAHQPGYINTGHYGEYAAMNPAALTVVITALDGE